MLTKPPVSAPSSAFRHCPNFRHCEISRSPVESLIVITDLVCVLVVVVGLGVNDLVQAGLQLDGHAVHDVGRHHRPAVTQEVGRLLVINPLGPKQTKGRVKN